MAKLKAQGTQLYFIDPDDGSVLEVSCVTSLSGLDATVEEIDTTCLSDLARTFEAGLANPGTATLGIQFDPEDPSNLRLYELYNTRENIQFAVGLSDGEDPPTATADEFTLPASRSWLVYEGYISAFPWDFSLNTMVNNNLSVRVSGQPTLEIKTA